MELCDSALEEVINEIKENYNLFRNDSLTLLGYYIASFIFIEILKGVNHLHQLDPQIIHRDLKPENILLKKKDNKISVKIADFGLIAFHKFAERSQTHTEDIGDIRYAAPEVLDGNQYDTKSDIYSLGIILQKLFEIDFDE
jgi:serine/threonine protein kinase